MASHSSPDHWRRAHLESDRRNQPVPRRLALLRALLRPGLNWQTGVVMGFAIAFALQWLGIVP